MTAPPPGSLHFATPATVGSLEFLRGSPVQEITNLPQMVANAHKQLALLQERHDNEGAWSQVATDLLDATAEQKAEIQASVRASRESYTESHKIRAFLLDVVALLHVSAEDRALTDEWSRTTAEAQRLAFAWCDTMDALLGQTAGLPPEALACARKMHFRAAKKDVFQRHEELFRRLA